MCVCLWLGSSCSFKHVSLNSKDKFCLYNLFKILSSFRISVLVSGWNWWMNLPKLSPEILLGVSVVVSYRIVYFEVCVVIYIY